MKDNLPESAFAFVEYKSGKRFFPHHNNSVTRGSQNHNVDGDNLLKAMSEVAFSKLTAKQKSKAFNHLSNHAKYIIGLSCDDEDKINMSSEMQFIIDEISENGFSEDVEFVTTPPTKIFKKGKWKGQSYKKEDLERIISNFKHFKNSFRPALKSGHWQETGVWQGKCEAEEAMGYIVDMTTDGTYIYGVMEFEKSVYETKIRNKKLQYKSCEICPVFTSDGKEYQTVLTGVALLGISPPAVSDLGSIVANPELYSMSKDLRVNFVVFDEDSDELLSGKEEKMDEENTISETPVVETPVVEVTHVVTETPEVEVTEIKSEVVPMVELSVDADMVAMKEQFEALRLQNLQFSEQVERQNKMILELATAGRRKDIANKVENLIRNENLKPADRDSVNEIFNALADCKQMVKLSADSDTELSLVEVFEQFLEGHVSWTKEEFATVKANAQTDLADSLPTVVKTGSDSVVDSNGHRHEVINNDIAAKAKAMYDKGISEGKKITLEECILNLS